MAQGFYGGYMGNAGALNDLVYRGEPNQTMPMPYYGGGMGIEQLAGGPDLPFGGGGTYKTTQEKFRPGSTDRQRIPDPIRIFPQNEPGREGAINVKFRQAQLMPGMSPMGNAGAGFTPSFQNPVVIPEGFQEQLDKMEEGTIKQQMNRFTNPGLYPRRFF